MVDLLYGLSKLLFGGVLLAFSLSMLIANVGRENSDAFFSAMTFPKPTSTARMLFIVQVIAAAAFSGYLVVSGISHLTNLFQ